MQKTTTERLLPPQAGFLIGAIATRKSTLNELCWNFHPWSQGSYKNSIHTVCQIVKDDDYYLSDGRNQKSVPRHDCTSQNRKRGIENQLSGKKYRMQGLDLNMAKFRKRMGPKLSWSWFLWGKTLRRLQSPLEIVRTAQIKCGN